MTGVGHATDVLRAFLDGETRQVWARDRATGEPVYIEDGAADAVRALAKAAWACIVPGCDTPISTRGGSKRDHFFHLTSVDHPGESQNHLAAKAMLAHWAASRTAGRARVVEEQTVKNRDLDLHRRPDVLVTRTADGHRLALEVEFKQYAVGDWRAKQDDFDRDGIACAWLIGHTRITVDQSADRYGRGTPVTVPALARALAESGRHVLVVNPVTRQIGTLAGDPALTSRLGGGWYAYLGVDDLTNCDLHPDHGVVTPSMRRIDEAEARRERQAAARRRREAAARQQSAERARQRQEKLARIETRNSEAWNASPLKQAIEQRWGEVPALLVSPGNNPHGIHAAPVHWHAAIYEACIHHRRSGMLSMFTADDCWDALRRQHIDVSENREKRLKSLVTFLRTLEHADMIKRASSQHLWRVLANIDTASERREAAGPARERQLTIAREGWAERERNKRLAARLDHERRAAAREDQRRIQRAPQESAWLASAAYETVVARYGCVPKCISWPNTEQVGAIDAHPALWRALVCLDLIQDVPAETVITIEQARFVLTGSGLGFAGDIDEVEAAIGLYLYNLHQRGILRYQDGDEKRYRTTGAALA